MNIAELATVQRHNLNIKIILFNNYGHSMCRATQRQWLGGEYPATSYEGGLSTPNFTAIAQAHGFEATRTQWSDAAMHAALQMLERDGPGFVELEIDRDIAVTPQARFGYPLEDQEPSLSREEIEAVRLEAA